MSTRTCIYAKSTSWWHVWFNVPEKICHVESCNSTGPSRQAGLASWTAQLADQHVARPAQRSQTRTSFGPLNGNVISYNRYRLAVTMAKYRKRVKPTLLAVFLLRYVNVLISHTCPDSVFPRRFLRHRRRRRHQRCYHRRACCDFHRPSLTWWSHKRQRL